MISCFRFSRKRRMNKFYQLCAAIGLSSFLSACIGAGAVSPIAQQGGPGVFPEMVGIDLLGQERLIPASFAKEFHIIAIGFERDHQEDINTWISVADELMAQHEALGFYEVPVIYELSAPYRFWVNNGMRSGIPSEKARERTITVYTDRPKFLEMMDMSPDRIYVLLVDPEGNILWREQGAATPASISSLRQTLRHSMGQ